MPELPEVETMRRGISDVIGCRIDDVEYKRCRLKPIEIGPNRRAFKRRVAGKQIVDTGRLGKRVVIRLESGDSVVVEPRMTGLLLVTDPPNQTHLRVGLHLSDGKTPSLWYWDRRGLGSLRVFSEEELAIRYGPDRLGPDALETDAATLDEKLGQSTREIKVALLDQKAVAGIGNLYASEILHVAGIHPQKRCRNMNRAMWQAVHEATEQVLTTAIRYEGSTLGDGTYRNALNQDGSFQNHHRVYMRSGKKCMSCREGVIQRIVQAQRSTFFCPSCQTKRGK